MNLASVDHKFDIGRAIAENIADPTATSQFRGIEIFEPTFRTSNCNLEKRSHRVTEPGARS